MDEGRLVDWFDVVEQVANGRLTGHACPLCGARPIETSAEGPNVRVRCPTCGEGFEGRLGHSRDDALYAEALEMERRRAAARAPVAPAGPTAAVAEAAPTPAAPRPVTQPKSPERRGEPWSWSLPSERAGDMEALSLWMDVVTAAHNGRVTGLTCPMCSEPLGDIDHRPPYLRVRCARCGEGFEGRVE
jgi:hypothetical protein